MSRNPLTSSEEAHLQTGTLDTTGTGAGDLRDVALIYWPNRWGFTVSDTVEPPQDGDPLTQEPLFDADGEPTPQALPQPSEDPQEPEEVPEDPQPTPDADSPPEPTPDDTDAEEDPAPVEPTARADKGSKAAPAAKTPNRRRAG